MTFKIMMQEVLSAIPDYTIVEAGVVRYEDVGTINGFQHMPATFAPRAAQGERLERVIGRWQAALDSEAHLEAEPAIAVSD